MIVSLHKFTISVFPHLAGIDEAITRRCFGFETVDDYYKHASSDQRLHAVDVPLMMINAGGKS